jgi:tetratricopeptide (TPR) repeat protein
MTDESMRTGVRRPCTANPSSIGRCSCVLAIALLGILSATASADASPRVTDERGERGGCVARADHAVSEAERLFYAGELGQALVVARGGGAMRKCSAAVRSTIHVELGKLYAFQAFTTNDGYDSALAELEQAARLARVAGDEILQSDAMTYEGFARFARVMNMGEGDYDAAMDSLQRGLALRREHGDRRRIAESLFYVGIVHERQGEDEAAMAAYRESHDLAAKGGFRLEDSYALRHLGFQAQKRGELQTALALFQKSLELRRQIGFQIYLPFSYLAVGDVLAQLGQWDRAEREYDAGCALAEAMKAQRVLVLCELSYGDLDVVRGDADAAKKRFERARRTADAIGFGRGSTAATTRLDDLQR